MTSFITIPYDDILSFLAYYNQGIPQIFDPGLDFVLPTTKIQTYIIAWKLIQSNVPFVPKSIQQWIIDYNSSLNPSINSLDYFSLLNDDMKKEIILNSLSPLTLYIDLIY